MSLKKFINIHQNTPNGALTLGENSDILTTTNTALGIGNNNSVNNNFSIDWNGLPTQVGVSKFDYTYFGFQTTDSFVSFDDTSCFYLCGNVITCNLKIKVNSVIQAGAQLQGITNLIPICPSILVSYEGARTLQLLITPQMSTEKDFDPSIWTLKNSSSSATVSGTTFGFSGTFLINSNQMHLVTENVPSNYGKVTNTNN